MSIAIVRTEIESPKYSENLLTKKSLFNSGSWVTNVTGGGGIIGADNSVLNQYKGLKGLLITVVDADGTIVTGDASMEITLAKTGRYVLSGRLFVPSTYDDQPCYFGIYVYRNGLLFNLFEFLIDDNSDFTFDDWNTYFQTFDLEAGDVMDFSFKVGFQGGTYIRFSFDAMKFELDNRQLGLPSAYSPPLDIVLDSTQTINIPSIASNSSHTVVVTLTGAALGDLVQLSYPAELVSLGLVVGYPVVSDVNEISFVVHNKSGGAIDPASGSYVFKIVK